jgi:hypothetical protein
VNTLACFIVIVISAGATVEPPVASQPTSKPTMQPVTLEEARGDLDWSMPEVQYRVQVDPNMPAGSLLRVEMELALSSEDRPESHQFGVAALTKTEAGRRLTEAQVALLKNGGPALPSLRESIEMTSQGRAVPGYNRILFQAATEEDARHMVEALVEVINNFRIKRRWSQLTFIAQERQAGTRLQGVQDEAKSAAEALEAACKRWGYGGADEDQVRRELVELQRAARLTEIELAGIKAKLEAIAKARQQEANEVLKRLQLEQDVELAGALARIDAIHAQQTGAEEVLRLFPTEKQKRAAADRQGQRESSIRRAERSLKEPEYGPVKFVKNEVTIYRPKE